MAADQDVGGEHTTFGDIASIADANEKVIRGPYCRMNDAREGVLRKLIDEVFPYGIIGNGNKKLQAVLLGKPVHASCYGNAVYCVSSRILIVNKSTKGE